MKNLVVGCSMLVMLLSACSKTDQQKSTPSAPESYSPTSAPPQLTVTNQPATASVPATPPVVSDKIEQGFEVTNAGNLFLTFPRTWKNMITRIPEGPRLVNSIMFRPRTNEEFDMMIGINNVGESKADAVDLRDALNIAGKDELTNSLENTLDIQDLVGPQITGCYFIVTDKTYSPSHPVKGQYPYLTQGYARIGGLLLSFRLVSNHLSPEQEQMLEMIKTARLEQK